MITVGKAIATAHPTNSQASQALLKTLKERALAVTDPSEEPAVSRHEDRGKWFVRKRINHLLDPGSPFLEIGQLAGLDLYGDVRAGAGIVIGIGRVSDRWSMIVANDATVKGGTYFPMTVKKHLRAQRIAFENQLPCIYLVDSG